MIDASQAELMPSLHVQQRRASAPTAPKASSDTVTVHRAFRYRLYPTPAQEDVLRQYAGVCRLVFNLGFEQRRDFWRQYLRAHGKHISYFSQSAELTQLRAAYDWIAAVPAVAAAYALRDLDQAFANFFAGRGRYPTPRRRDQGHGFRLKGKDTRARILSDRWGELNIPKLGWVRFRTTRPIRGTVRNISINCTAGAWHVSFAADWEEAGAKAAPTAVGLDLGVVRTVTLSTGEHHSLPPQDRALQALKRAQRALARKKKGSGRHAAQKARIAKLQAKAARVRADWSHKLTTDMADRFGFVVAEDLKIKNMTASAAGTIAAPGKGVAQKRGLNRAILSQSWGRLTTQLAYKLDERGGALILVNPAFSSQTCSDCGVVDAKSRESQAVFRCVHCGFEDNADVNAAREILRRGTARAEEDSGPPLKRNPEGLQHV